MARRKSGTGGIAGEQVISINGIQVSKSASGDTTPASKASWGSVKSRQQKATNINALLDRLTELEDNSEELIITRK